MPANTETIQVPVSLQVNASELQSIINDLQASMEKVKPDSKAYAKLSSELVKIQGQMDAITADMRQGFQNPAQLNKFEQKIRNLGTGLQTMATQLSRVTFEDLNIDLIPKEELDKLQQLQQALAAAQARVDGFQTTKMQELVGQSEELAETFKTLSLDINTTKYDQALNKSSKKLDELQEKATKSAERVAKAQAAADKTKGAIFAREHAKGIFNLNDTEYNKAYFERDAAGKVTQFNRNGGRKLLESQLEEWGLTSAQIKEFKKTTVEGLADFYKTIEDTINNQKNIDKLDKKNAAAQVELIDAQKEQASVQEVIGSIQQLVDTLRQLYDIQNENNPHYEELKKQTEAVRENEEAVEQQKTAIKEYAISNQNLTQNNQRVAQSEQEMGEYVQQTTQAMREQTAAQREMEASQQRLSAAIRQWFSFREVINLTKRAISDAVNHIKELDATMTQIAVVTDMSQSDLWGQISTYSAIAQQYGVSTNGVYQVSQLFYQSW